MLDEKGGKTYYLCIRAVAQLVSVHVWGTWGRRFKSGQPEPFNPFLLKELGVFYIEKFQETIKKLRFVTTFVTGF